MIDLNRILLWPFMTQNELVEMIVENGIEPNILLTIFRPSLYDELVVQYGTESKARLSTFISFIEDDRILAKTKRGNLFDYIESM